MWVNLKHLKDASETSNQNLGYFKHMFISIKEAGFCFLMFLGSIVHAFIPWVLDFKLISWRVQRLEMLKLKFPNDPVLKNIEFKNAIKKD
jgi:hypothetical protein